jgi:prepilin-type N-terminal cleavage/methylation domain-containing protein
MINTQRGFTLIELLVVISIISLLSSVVLSSLSSAREEATATAIKTEARELLKLAQMHYFQTGNYTTFVSQGWVATDAECQSRILGTAINQISAEAICKSMISKISDPTSGTTNVKVYLGVNEPNIAVGNSCTDEACFAINTKVVNAPGRVVLH